MDSEAVATVTEDAGICENPERAPDSPAAGGKGKDFQQEDQQGEEQPEYWVRTVTGDLSGEVSGTRRRDQPSCSDWILLAMNLL